MAIAWQAFLLGDQIAYARELPTHSVTFTGCDYRVLLPFCRISPFIGIH